MNSAAPKSPPPPISPRVLAFAAVGLVLVGGMFVAAVRSTAGNLPPRFDLAAHQSALNLWETHGPANYDIAIRVTGAQPASYRVSVRRGEPQSASRNDSPLTQKRSFSTWSVDGMFGTLAQDVERWQGAKSQKRSPPFDLRVQYDSQFGYPARYQRRETSSPVVVEWQVTQFEIVNNEQEPNRE